MDTLSVVLATYNEAKNLPDCLASIKDLADEIIVVDGSSTDTTVEIAKTYGAKVSVTTNPQIFHINKQKAIDQATKDWILQLDADERVSTELTKEIKQAIRDKERQDVNGYWIPRKNYFLGRFLLKGGQYPDYTLRLYRKGKGKLPQKDVHEQALVEGKVGYLHHPLEHYADPTLSRYLLRWNRYTNLLAKQLQEQHVGLLQLPTYMILKPIWWFVWTYGRHKGFMDSWQGFVFAFFSALRFPVGYLKSLRLRNDTKDF